LVSALVWQLVAVAWFLLADALRVARSFQFAVKAKNTNFKYLNFWISERDDDKTIYTY